MIESGSSPAVSETRPSPESRTEPFRLRFQLTDHSLRDPESGSPDTFRALCKDIKINGGDALRTDFDWNHVEVRQGQLDLPLIQRFIKGIEIIREEGLEPVIVLSNAPKWAKEMYKKGDKEGFYAAWESFNQTALAVLESVPGEPVKEIQVLNELNNPVYSQIDPEDISSVAGITRRVFEGYNPDIKLVASMLVADIPEYMHKGGFAETIKTYLPKFETHAKGAFDIISLDYYPGAWYRPIHEQSGLKRKLEIFRKVIAPNTKGYKEMFTEFGLLQEVAERVASWGKEYEIDEIGFPTKGMYWGNERRQRYAYDVHTRKLKEMLVDFRKRNIPLPTGIGTYMAKDEPVKGIVGTLRKLIPDPEPFWGQRTAEGKPKLILKGAIERVRDIKKEILNAKFVKAVLREKYGYYGKDLDFPHIAESQVSQTLWTGFKKENPGLSGQKLDQKWKSYFAQIPNFREMVLKREVELMQGVEAERLRLRESIKPRTEGSFSRLKKLGHYLRTPMNSASDLSQHPYSEEEQTKMDKLRKELWEQQENQT